MTDLPIGRIAGAFGIRGELKCDPTSAGRTLFFPGAALRYVLNGTSHEARVADLREHKGRFLLRLEGVNDATAAEALTGATFFAHRDDIELEEGEYLDVDLVGCRLEDPSGKDLGTVMAVEHYPSSDMLIVKGRMVPMVHAFMRSIDIGAKKIVAELPPGLLDDDTETA